MKSSDLKWKGFLRADGSKGIRNIVLVVYTVECAKHVAQQIVNGVHNVHIIGFSGCQDNEFAIRLLLALSRHPNVGAALFVGLGCEYTQPDQLCKSVKQSGRISDWFYIQDEGGTLDSIKKGKSIVQDMRKDLDRTSRITQMDFKDMIVGSACGGSDFTSGLSGNPLAGLFLIDW